MKLLTDQDVPIGRQQMFVICVSISHFPTSDAYNYGGLLAAKSAKMTIPILDSLPVSI